MTFAKLKRSLLAGVLAGMMLLASCGKTAEPLPPEKVPTVPDEEIVEIDDKYKNFYEIFVRSFCDSDGDGYGDFNGITQKLDYLKPVGSAAGNNSLGVNGIWLMPICPSPSYHKYNVSDYFAVDPKYGTMEDFENLVKQCHEHGITLIIDMVLNHTATDHEWFRAFCAVQASREEGKVNEKYDDKYGDYYSVVDAKTMEEKGTRFTSGTYAYYKIGSSRYQKVPGAHSYYECNFDDSMPELNYDCPYVWEEVEKICDFWIDKGVDGFRFDAVLYFYYLDTERNTEVLRRIQEYCKSKNPNFYTVGEAWTSVSTVKEYFRSGFDSFFNFSYANNSGFIVSAVKGKQGSIFAKRLQNWNNSLKLVSATDAIDAPFLSNHDMARSSGTYSTLGQKKMAASIYLMMPGNPFIYYGEEIGLKGNTTDSTKKDPTARMAIKWSAMDDGSKMIPPDGADTTVKQDTIDGVYEQLKDENSLLTHYRLLLKLRNQNPQIARGTVTACDFGKDSVCAYTSVYNGTAVMVIHNLSLDDTECDLNALGYSDFSELRGYLVAKNAEGEKESDSAPVLGASSQEETDDAEKPDPVAKLEGGKLTLPGRTTVVLRSDKHYDDVVIDPGSITTSADDDKVQAMGED